MVAGFDIGTGGAATTLYFVEGRDGTFGDFAEHHARMANQESDLILRLLTMWTMSPGFTKNLVNQSTFTFVLTRLVPINGDGVEEPSKGYGGFHFDPEIDINKDGVLCLVWGWDAGQDAEMVYSLNRGNGWSTPKKIADVNWGKPGLASLSTDSKGQFSRGVESRCSWLQRSVLCFFIR